MRAIPDIAYDFINRAEACKLTSYLDSADVWTIAWGHTGPEVHAGLVWSILQAKTALISDMKVAAARLALAVNDAVIRGLSDHQYAALLSFVFNLGADRSWAIWKLLNAGKLDGVPDQILRFDHAKDPKTGELIEVPGLLNRRMAEVSLWKAPDLEAAVAVVAAAPIPAPPSSQTRADITPPRPVDIGPLAQSKAFLTVISSAILAAPPAIKGAGDAIAAAAQPYADHSHWAAKAIELASTASFAAAAAGAIFILIKHREAKQ